MKARVKATGKIVEVKYSRQLGHDAVYRDLATGEHYMDFELSILPEDGTLALFKTKPMCFYEEGIGHYWAGHALYLPRNEYPEVTFENSPQEVELKLIEK